MSDLVLRRFLSPARACGLALFLLPAACSDADEPAADAPAPAQSVRIDPLTEAARSDASDLVRISAAEALASLPAEAAIPSWLAILEANGPARVRVQVWIGLARAGHPSAVDRFYDLLDRCGGDGIEVC